MTDIREIMDVFWERFQLWLVETAAIPAANDNPGPRNPYEGWQG